MPTIIERTPDGAIKWAADQARILGMHPGDIINIGDKEYDLTAIGRKIILVEDPSTGHELTVSDGSLLSDT